MGSLRACENITSLLRTPLCGCGGVALREYFGHLARQTPSYTRSAPCLARKSAPSLRPLIFSQALSWRLCSVLLSACASAHANDAVSAAPSGCGDQSTCVQPQPVKQPDTWVDNSFGYVTTRADSLAVWLDSFFGKPTSDLESADSVLRLRLEHQWDQEEGDKDKIRLRGKVDLPRINRRLSLVFSEENEDREEVIPDNRSVDDAVGLQYRIRDRDDSRLYLSVGTNSSLDFKTSLRYKYKHSINADWRTQFSERLYYTENDGYGTLTRGDIDYSIDANRIVRWTNQFDYGEETDGVEWGSRLDYQARVDAISAVSYFAAVSGRTDPDNLTQAYALGVRYRRSWFRPWIFFEVEPSHVWRRETELDSRQAAWVLTFRIELLEEIRNRGKAN